MLAKKQKHARAPLQPDDFAFLAALEAQYRRILAEEANAKQSEKTQ